MVDHQIAARSFLQQAAAAFPAGLPEQLAHIVITVSRMAARSKPDQARRFRDQALAPGVIVNQRGEKAFSHAVFPPDQNGKPFGRILYR